MVNRNGDEFHIAAGRSGLYGPNRTTGSIARIYDLEVGDEVKGSKLIRSILHWLNFI